MQYCARVDNFKICNFQGDSQKLKRCAVRPSDPLWVPEQSRTSEFSKEYLMKLNQHANSGGDSSNSTGQWQLYDLDKDPFELFNLGSN